MVIVEGHPLVVNTTTLHNDNDAQRKITTSGNFHPQTNQTHSIPFHPSYTIILLYYPVYTKQSKIKHTSSNCHQNKHKNNWKKERIIKFSCNDGVIIKHSIILLLKNF